MDQQQRNFQNRIIAISIMFSLLSGFIAGAFSSDLWNRVDWGLSSGNQYQSLRVVTQEEQIVKVAKDVSPAVVSIIVAKNLSNIQRHNPFQGTPFELFWPSFGGSQDQVQEIAGGSGFIVSEDGMILTNKHVVSDENADYTVLANDGKKYAARILARDPVQDIAILKIDKKNLPVLKLGNSDEIKVGQTVIAVGNSLGEFRNTVSVGVISGLRRSVLASTGFGMPAEQLEGVIQTDAAINPGNSGGPLINLAGEVVGINVAMAEGAQSIGFALPSNKAARDIAQVKRSGKITYPYLGVRYSLITSEIKQLKQLSVDEGAVIVAGQNAGEAAVDSESPADKAGLKENDIILEVDGQKITAENSLAQIIQSHNVGDAITLKVLSGGEMKTLKVVLGER